MRSSRWREGGASRQFERGWRSLRIRSGRTMWLAARMRVHRYRRWRNLAEYVFATSEPSIERCVLGRGTPARLTELGALALRHLPTGASNDMEFSGERSESAATTGYTAAT